MQTDRFDAAFCFAHELHRAPPRKAPNILPLMTVASLAMEYDGTEDQVLAGLPLDAPEDERGEPTLTEIRWRFGNTVAGIAAGKCKRHIAWNTSV